MPCASRSNAIGCRRDQAEKLRDLKGRFKSLGDREREVMPRLITYDLSRTAWTGRPKPSGRKKNDNQRSAGVVGNLDVPVSPVLLLSIETHAFPY